MAKIDHLPSVTDILDVAAKCLDVRHLSDEEVIDVTGGPEVLNTGNET